VRVRVYGGGAVGFQLFNFFLERDDVRIVRTLTRLHVLVQSIHLFDRLRLYEPHALRRLSGERRVLFAEFVQRLFHALDDFTLFSPARTFGFERFYD